MTYDPLTHFQLWVVAYLGELRLYSSGLERSYCRLCSIDRVVVDETVT